ncbi:MAG: outer membrane protein TolC [Flavobacteriales bacterium]|jgi:outer membrane protein TolC
MKKLLAGASLWFAIHSAAAANLTLDTAIALAVNNDEWLKSSSLIESAYRDEATSHNSLPDPTLSLDVANLPIDSWDFNQENMTQFKMGITQRFPSGDSRRLKARKSQLMADVNPYMRLNRSAQLVMTVSHLWMDSFLALKSIELINNDRYLFEQLVEVTTSRYQSAMGQARQQDVVRAQLELTKLEDRLTMLRMNYDASRQLLSEWLPSSSQLQTLTQQLPELTDLSTMSVTTINQAIKRHPQLLISDRQIAIKQAEVDLLKQNYKPNWALTASYGYREDSPLGIERSDFVSVGVSFDLPLFTENRQDKNVSAANFRKQSTVIDYQLLERKLGSQALRTLSDIQRLKQRTNLYETKLLQQINVQAEASLTAYTNDDGDFADVMRAFIAELNTKIEVLEIKVRQQKVTATMNYLMTGLQRSPVVSRGDDQ